MGTQQQFDVLGIGNAIVDVLTHTDDDEIASHGLERGSMTLIDNDRADALYAAAQAPTMASGGSVANSVAMAASFGADVAYTGKVRDDSLGAAFTQDIRQTGVSFDTPAATQGAGTARCFVMVSPDGQRTLSTYLGACLELGSGDIDADLVARSQVCLLEGYLWDSPDAQQACQAVIAAARAAGRKVALTVSDSLCVERHRAEFRELVESTVDVLFANEDELRALYETDSVDEALRTASSHGGIIAMTHGEKGSVVASRGAFDEVPAEPIDRVVDTTGAGDAYAAGFLYGLTRGLDLPLCARLGAIAAAEIISHVGARPETRLADLAAPALSEAS
jgi:sugar/nucleoside kinase (ribokinase family)